MIKELVKKLAGEMPDNFILAKVVKVDEDKQTVDIAPVNGDAKVFGVSLQPRAIEQGFVLVPSKDTHVLVAMIDETSGYVIMRDELDHLKLKANNVDLKTEIDNLIDIMNTLITTLAQDYKLIVPVGGMSTGVAPDSMAKLQQEKQKLSRVKSNVGKLIKSF